jgi:hypothetical protein
VASTIGGGQMNTIGTNASFAVISGGVGNTANDTQANIGGGSQNSIQTGAAASTIGGGLFNIIRTNAAYATISGGKNNTIQTSSDHAVIGGGEFNTIETLARYGTIGGGIVNRIESAAEDSTIAGGNLNVIKTNARFSAIAGGQANFIGTDATRSTIGGGEGNNCNGSYGTITGGRLNTIQTNTFYAVIVGGYLNTVTGSYATASGGTFNDAAGNYSFAAGRRAKANQGGTFVWADSSDFDFPSAETNEFAVRATGGVRFVSGIDTSGAPVAGVSLPAGSGSWSSLSDRNAKENLRRVDSRVVLEKVAALPLATWNYKSQDTAVRHIGPMAQDFRAAFGVGENDTTITTIDADGVALAAIQGLNQKLETEVRSRNVEIQALRKQLADLEKHNDEREARLARLGKVAAAWNGTRTAAVASRVATRNSSP